MIACPHCDRRPFADPNDAYNHIKAKHGASKAGRFRREYVPARVYEREPSIGEELAESLVAAACGEEVPEHIERMFPDEIAEARRQGGEASR